MISAVKQQSLLQGQTGLARKVFDCVPIQEAWTLDQIQRTLRLAVNGSSAEARVIRGCLGELEDQRLVCQPQKGVFQRVEIRTHESKEPKPMKPVATVTPITKPVAAAPTAPLEILGELSGEIVALTEEFGARLKKLANRIEEAAIIIEQDCEANAASAKKLKALQELLTGA